MKLKTKAEMTWQLKPVSESVVSGVLKPGLYSLQNKKSGTFAMLAPTERTIGCWPKTDFADNNTKVVRAVRSLSCRE